MGFTVRNLNGTPYSVRQKGSSVVIHRESTVIILVKALLYPKFDFQDNFMFRAVCGCGQTRAFFPGNLFVNKIMQANRIWGLDNFKKL